MVTADPMARPIKTPEWWEEVGISGLTPGMLGEGTGMLTLMFGASVVGTGVVTGAAVVGGASVELVTKMN